jgi:hypothetical protein
MHRQVLVLALLALAAATLLHHVHNAEFLADYPNMPASLTRGHVYLAWLGAAAVGVAGYALLRCGWRRLGTALLIAYGCYGLDGLVHYLLAPVSAHTPAMNLSIAAEAITAAVLLVVVVGTLISRPARSG